MRIHLIRVLVLCAALLIWGGSHEAEAATQYSQNIIPKMTSLTSPSGIVTASDDGLKAFEPAWKAFDGDIKYKTGSTYSAWGTHKTTGWLAYEFPTARTVSKYVMYAGNPVTSGYNSHPDTWTFEGSNGGSTWTVLDSRAGIKWTPTEVKEFTFTNTTPYKAYRINVTKNGGSTSNTANLFITELQMMEVTTQAPAAPILTGTAAPSVNHLTWGAVTDATGYNIKRSTTAGGPYTLIASGVTGTNYEDTAVTNGTTYYYTMTAVNMAGESSASNEIALTPQVAMLNLLRNPSFEQYTGTNGVADFWTPYIAVGSTAEYSIVTTPVSEGGHSERMYAAGLGLNNAVEVYQRVKVEPNKPFHLSADFNITDLSNAKVQLWVDYYKSETGWEWSNKKYYDYVETTNGGFVTLELADTIPSDVVSVQVYAILKGTGENGTGTMYVDNMQFEQ